MTLQEPERDPFSAPQVPGGEFSAPSPPSTIDNAFWAGIASVVVGFAILVASYLSVSDTELEALLLRPDRSLTPDQAWGLFYGVMAFVAVLTIITAALWITFLFLMRRGRNWARIVIAVVGAVWIVLTIPTIGDLSAGIVLILLAVLQVLTVAATLVFAYLAPSNEYFRSARHR